jgi:5-methylcytosine-specific restriction protein B
MTHADDVRTYCIENITAPALERGEKQIAIRAGDIHSAIGYRNRMPLACAALGANKFEEIAAVERITVTGPTNGANAIFTFRIK